MLSLSILGKSVMCELKRDAQCGNRNPCLDQDDDVTSEPDPLSSPQSRHVRTRARYAP